MASDVIVKPVLLVELAPMVGTRLPLASDPKARSRWRPRRSYTYHAVAAAGSSRVRGVRIGAGLGERPARGHGVEFPVLTSESKFCVYAEPSAGSDTCAPAGIAQEAAIKTATAAEPKLRILIMRV